MRKIRMIILISLLAAMVVITVGFGGPDYTEEFNVLVSKVNAIYDTRQEARVALEGDYDVSGTDIGMVNDQIILINQEAISALEPLVEEAKKYEEGVSDVDAYQGFFANIEQNKAIFEGEIADYENWKIYDEIYQNSELLINIFKEYIKVAVNDISAYSTSEERVAYAGVAITVFEEYIVEMQGYLAETEQVKISGDSSELTNRIATLNGYIEIIQDAIAYFVEIQ